MNNQLKITALLMFLMTATLLKGQNAAQTVRAPSSKLYLKIVFNTPDQSARSHVSGRYWIKSGKKIIARGDYKLEGFQTPESRQIVMTVADSDTIDWQGQGLEWNFNGKLYDATLDKTLPVGSMNMSTFSTPPAGVGFEVIVNADGQTRINNKFYTE